MPAIATAARQYYRIPVGLQPTDLFRGESRDPPTKRQYDCQMDPGLRRGCDYLCARAPHSALWRVGVGVVGSGQQMAAAGLVRPIFPGAPGLGRIRAVAPVAGVDLALRQIFDLA